eukprot:2288768-Karenia_brevis.AAC.1
MRQDGMVEMGHMISTWGIEDVIEGVGTIGLKACHVNGWLMLDDLDIGTEGLDVDRHGMRDMLLKGQIWF